MRPPDVTTQAGSLKRRRPEAEATDVEPSAEEAVPDGGSNPVKRLKASISDCKIM